MTNPATQNHALKAGQIMTYSWGYDQTNIEFFEVVKATPKTVTVRPVKALKSRMIDRDSEGNKTGINTMRGWMMPRAGAFAGDPIRKTVKSYSGGLFCSMDHGVMRPWDGKAEEWTGYA